MSDQLPKIVSELMEKKGFKSVEGLAESYANLESKLGNSIKRPGKYATEEQMNQFQVELGRPENIEGYEMDDSVVSEDVLKTMFKNGVTKSAAKEIESVLAAKIASAADATKADRAKKFSDLKAELGDDATTASLESFKKVTQALEMDETASEGLLDTLGYKNAFKISKLLADNIGEGKKIDGKPSYKIGTPMESLLRFNKDNNAALMDKRHEGHRAALAKQQELMASLRK